MHVFIRTLSVPFHNAATLLCCPYTPVPKSVIGLTLKFRYFANTANSIKTVKPKQSIGLKWVITGSVVVGFAVGGIGAILAPSFSYDGARRGKKQESSEVTVVDHRPQPIPSRRIINKSDTTGLNLTLYQYQTCPFCSKVRAFLDYYGLSYDVVEVNPVFRKEIKWSSYRKVPLLVSSPEASPELYLKDSTLVISILKTFLVRGDQLSPNDVLKFYPIISSTDSEGKTKMERMNKFMVMYGTEKHSKARQQEKKWREWADNKLVHFISPNVYRTPKEALQAFHYFSDVGEWERLFPNWERHIVIYVGATVMYFIGKRLKKKYQLTDDVRRTLYDACQQWMKNVGKRNKFMGGSQPNLADLAVYGVLSSMEGCETFHDVVANTDIGPWYENTKNAVQNNNGATMLLEKCQNMHSK